MSHLRFAGRVTARGRRMIPIDDPAEPMTEAVLLELELDRAADEGMIEPSGRRWKCRGRRCPGRGRAPPAWGRGARDGGARAGGRAHRSRGGGTRQRRPPAHRFGGVVASGLGGPPNDGGATPGQ